MWILGQVCFFLNNFPFLIGGGGVNDLRCDVSFPPDGAFFSGRRRICFFICR